MPSFAELERDDAKTSMKRISYALDMTLDGLAVERRRLGQLGGRVSLRADAERRLRECQHHARSH